MADEEFNFTGQLRPIINSLKDLTVNEIIENKEDWESIKASAQKLLDKVKEYNLYIQNIEGFNTKGRNLIKNQNSSIIQEVYRAAIDFDLKLTEYFGHPKKQMAYVFQGNDGQLETYILPLTELVNLIDSEGRIGYLSQSKKNLSVEHLLEEQEGLDKHISQSQAAVLGIQARLERYKEVFKQSTISGGILMWLIQKQWTLARVASGGDIKEAYAVSIMSAHQAKCQLCNIATGGPKYYSHELIAEFFKAYINPVTNGAAIKGEDLILSNTQYAIKSEGAALPGLKQYVVTAAAVITLNYPGKVREFIDQAFQEGKTRNEILIEKSNKIAAGVARNAYDSIQLELPNGITKSIGEYIRVDIIGERENKKLNKKNK